MGNNDNLSNQQVQTKNNGVLIALMAIIILILAGYIVYTKFIQNDNNSVVKSNGTRECNCSNSSTSCLGEKITSLKKIDLTTTNQEIKIGEKTYKIRKDNSGIMYVDDQKINHRNESFYPSFIYLTDKYLFATVTGQYYESVWYAIDEHGEIDISNDEYTMKNFKIVDGYLHATGGKLYSTEYDLMVDMKDLLIKYIDNTLIFTSSK